ncbi:MAG: glycosyltransferase [Nanoarchaeota archaeon]|nr:glycosyltransferase [Nanoarchaeota archaeon]MBU1103331.1 glycosyltransferase [Nanoarchaeota archaeon]
MERKIKQPIGIILIIIGMVLLVNQISQKINLSPPDKTTYFPYILGIAFLFIGMLILTSRKTLDAIIILGNPSEETVKKRTKRALEAKAEKGGDSTVFLITGGKTSGLDKKAHSEAQLIYKELRKANVRPVDIRAETRSNDTIENLVNVLKKVDGTEIGVVSYPGHLDRVNEIVERGKEAGLFDKRIHLYRLETKATTKDRLYGPIARLLTKYKLRRVLKNKGEGFLEKAGRYITEKIKKSNKMKKPKIAALICAYNEEKHIGKVVNQCFKQMKNVIVVNDGSTDKTLDELKKTKAKIISYKTNQGKGFALKKGFSWAIKNKFDYLVLLDADGQHLPSEIPKFVKEIKKSKPDLIVGCRKKRHSDMPYIRRATNFLSSLIISIKGKTYVKDTQSGYRAINLNFIKKIKLKRKRYDLESEILIKMMKQKAKIKCIPIKTIYKDETSTIHPIKDTARFIRALRTK